LSYRYRIQECVRSIAGKSAEGRQVHRSVGDIAGFELLYVELLREQDYSNKTFTIRMGFVFPLLKANGVATPSKLIKLPKIRRTRTKAYNSDELSKLFAAMTPEEYLRYLFFVRTGCREQEVQYATWKDLDLKGLRFMVSGDGKSDVAFVPKNHEERQVPLTTELGSLLADYKKHAVSCVI
jgi:integrase/recombinase XerD